VKIWQWVPAYDCHLHYNIVPQVLAESETFDAIKRAAEAKGTDVSDWQWKWSSNHGCDLVRMRNAAVHQAVVEGFDYLLMQDADVYATKPALPRLLDSIIKHDAIACFALVLMRTRPPKACVWPLHGEYIKPGEVFEVRKAGTGMVLIDIAQIRRFYDRLPGPLFWRTYTDRHCHAADCGLDIWFSKLVTDPTIGGKIICDGRVPTVHVDGTHELAYDGEHLPAEYEHPQGETTDLAESREPSGGQPVECTNG